MTLYDFPEQAIAEKGDHKPGNPAVGSMRWEKFTRYYEACLHPDLWGEWMLTVHWGRRSTQLGQMRNRPCTTCAEGLAWLAAVGKQWVQRGYQAVSRRYNDMV